LADYKPIFAGDVIRFIAKIPSIVIFLVASLTPVLIQAASPRVSLDL
jgi:hypothetical protein